MKISIPEDCGNAPRKLFLKDFNVAFAKANIKFLLAHVSADVNWNIVGDKTIKGKDDFRKVLKDMSHQKAKALEIHKIITHGVDASVNGVVTLANGKRISFCDVYTFASAKGLIIKSIDSYVMVM